MSLVSPIPNSITFKEIGGNYPNKWNRLHVDRKQGGWTVLNYCQKFTKDHTCYMQFVSPDDDTIPTMTVYFSNGQTLSIIGTLADSVEGDQNRYWFNFEITFGANYYDKYFTIKVVQGSTTLTSEPVYVYDMTEEIENGAVKYVKYSNLDRNISDLSGYFIKWDVIDNTEKYMDFFVEASDRESDNKFSNAVLDGAQSRTIIASQLYSGITFATGVIPDYMCLKLSSVIGLDVLYINDTRYIIDGDADQSITGGSTSHTYNVTLIEKNTIGINIDDLGIENTDTVEYHLDEIKSNVSADITATEPADYYTAMCFVEQKGTPIESYITVKLGYSIGSSELGQVRVYNNGKQNPIQINQTGGLDTANTIYITVPTQAGNILEFTFNYQLAII